MDALLARRAQSSEQAEGVAAEVIADVRANGDEALVFRQDSILG